MLRSILGQLLPEAMVHFLENHGAWLLSSSILSVCLSVCLPVQLCVYVLVFTAVHKLSNAQVLRSSALFFLVNLTLPKQYGMGR